MNPANVPAPSQTGLAAPAAPTGQAPVAPSGAPALPPLPQGTAAPSISQQAPTNFDTGAMTKAIADYYQIPRDTALATAATKANEYNATTAYNNQLQLQSKEASMRLSKDAYKVIQTKDGVQILDPVSGQPVDIGTYVNRTGANPAEVLSKSTNPQDQQFVQDYNNFEQFMNAAIQKGQSKEAAQVYQSFLDANPALANITPQQAAKMFLGQYGNYFGVGQAGPTPTSVQYTPQYTPSIEQYIAEKSLFGISPIGSAAAGTQSSPSASMGAQLSSLAGQ